MGGHEVIMSEKRGRDAARLRNANSPRDRRPRISRRRRMTAPSTEAMRANPLAWLFPDAKAEPGRS